MNISGAGAVFGNGTLSQVISDAAAVRSRLDGLTRQAGDGLVSDVYSGLGSGASVSLSLGSALAQLHTWQSNTQAATGQMATAQTALSQISSIASTYFAQTASLTGLSGAAIDATAASARDALGQVASLLNSKYGDVYVFAGTDRGSAPVPGDIMHSGAVVAIGSAVVGLAGAGAAATLASTLASASSNAAAVSPFSASLSQPAAALAGSRSLVRAGPGAATPTGVLASTNGDVVSTGSSTTGSYVRDIIRALATIGALSGSQASTPGLLGLVTDTHTSLGDAISSLNTDAGVMGNRQASLTSTQQNLGDAEVALKSQVSNVQDVDMAATLSRLTATQTQLQASYQLLGALRSLSLASVLGGG